MSPICLQFSKKKTPVATCKFTESLNETVGFLQDNVTALGEDIKFVFGEFRASLFILERKILELQENNAILTQVEYTGANNDSMQKLQRSAN